MKSYVKILCLILALIFALAACDESEPLPEGVSSVPDVPEESLVDSETGEIKWPAELLPEGFPVPEYTEIYSAERKDNEVVIVMFADNKKGGAAHYKFENDLCFKYGYRGFTDMETGENYLFNLDGYRIIVTSSKHPDNHLEAINKKSPTGYTYEIRVVHTDLKIESLFWQYPDKNTDLGLEEKVFEEWDESVFPENFPKPTNGLTIVSIEQKNNGVFLTLKGTVGNADIYQKEIYKSGFYASSIQPFPNENGDYFFVEYPDSMTNPDSQYTFIFQVCKYNDKVVK